MKYLFDEVVFVVLLLKRLLLLLSYLLILHEVSQQYKRFSNSLNLFNYNKNNFSHSFKLSFLKTRVINELALFILVMSIFVIGVNFGENSKNLKL